MATERFGNWIIGKYSGISGLSMTQLCALHETIVGLCRTWLDLDFSGRRGIVVEVS